VGSNHSSITLLIICFEDRDAAGGMTDFVGVIEEYSGREMSRLGRGWKRKSGVPRRGRNLVARRRTPTDFVECARNSEVNPPRTLSRR